MKKTLSKRARPELSRRELQVLKLLLAEYSQAEIGKLLNLKPTTVNGIKHSLMLKWGVESIVGLTREGIKRGYLELEDDEPIIGINL